MVTVAGFKVLFPEFAGEVLARVQVFIDQAARRVNATQWGSRADDGVSYLAAHLLYSGNLGAGAPAGAVESERVGDIAVSYAVADLPATELASTSYGRRYLDLRSLVFSGRCL